MQAYLRHRSDTYSRYGNRHIFHVHHFCTHPIRSLLLENGAPEARPMRYSISYPQCHFPSKIFHSVGWKCEAGIPTDSLSLLDSLVREAVKHHVSTREPVKMASAVKLTSYAPNSMLWKPIHVGCVCKS